MKRASGKVAGAAGVSLLETMVASALAMVVIAAALEVFVTHHAYFLGQRTTAELLQDVRGGVDLLAAELRLASSITAMQAEEIGFRANVNDFRGRIMASANQGQNIAEVTPSSGWVKGKTLRFCSPSACEEQVLARDGISGHLTLAGPLLHDVPVGGQVEVINQVRYYLSRSLAGNWKLMREVDRGANPLVEHMEKFSLTYLKNNGAGATRLTEVRLVRLTLGTSGSDGRGKRITRQHTQDLGVRAL